MDLYNFLIAVVFLLLSIVLILLAQKMPKGKEDISWSRLRMYFASVVFLITGLFYLFKSF